MNLKNTTHIAAWLVVGSLGVFVGVLIVIIIMTGGEVSILESTEKHIILPLAIIAGMLRVAILVYPVSIVWRGVKEKNYQFLRSPIHYVAIPITLFIWIVSLL
ncbi:MAG: hypothetical protein ACI9VM_000330 [Candidatus Azotimanducaceae bacterium]|jgi:hypothetical protein